MTMDYEKAASFWDEQAKGAAVMERGALERVADAFLSSHNTCALATGWDGFVRCTPLEYTWRNNRFWFLSEGGHKFTALAHNQNVSLAVFEPYEGLAVWRGYRSPAAHRSSSRGRRIIWLFWPTRTFRRRRCGSWIIPCIFSA